MIPVIELIMSLRYELGDMQGINVSDYELIKPINQAASLLYGTLSERYVHAVLKKRPVTVGEDKEYSLPSDFVRVHQVIGDKYGVLTPSSTNPPPKGSYRIVGNTLYADEDTYTFEYYYIPSRVLTLGDMLDIPESMRAWIEQIALAFYKKDLGTAAGLVQQCENVLAGREISHFENTGPAQVLGGRI